MFEKEKDYFYIEEFRAFGIEARYGGKNHTLEVGEKTLIKGIQTHSKNIEVIAENYKIETDDCDGFVTNRKDVILVTKHADCLALFFYDKKNSAIGICHSGWKGSYEEIGKNLITLLKENYGSSERDILVGIGIGISQKNYEVQEEFYTLFKERFSYEIVEKSFLKKENSYYFNNEIFNYYLLQSYGILEENIIISKKCTFDDSSLHSYRRDRENSGRNLAYIFKKK